MQMVTNELNPSFYINLLRQLPGLIVVMDKNSKFLYSNRYTAELFGYTDEDNMVGIDAYGMKCPAVESAPQFIHQDRTVIESGIELTMLDIHTYANGENKILITKKSPYMVENEIAGSICHCTEINAELLRHVCATLIQSDKKYYSNQNHSNRSYIVSKSNIHKQLTDREMDCIFYLLRGNTMKKIAKYLNISPRTVETHLEQIKNKLNCGSKSDIVEQCLAEGMLNYIPSTFLNKEVSDIIYPV